MIRRRLYSAVLIFVVAELRGQGPTKFPAAVGSSLIHRDSDGVCREYHVSQETGKYDAVNISGDCPDPIWLYSNFVTGDRIALPKAVNGGFVMTLPRDWRCHQHITRHSIGLTCTKLTQNCANRRRNDGVQP